MSIWIYISIPVVIVAFFATAYWFFGRDKPQASTTPSNQGAWWSEHKDIIYSLLYVSIAIVAINVLCAKIGFKSWNNVWKHQAFWPLNTALLITVFLMMVGKKSVVKWFAGLLVFIVCIGLWRIGSTETTPPPPIVPTSQPTIEANYTIKPGEVYPKAFPCDSIVSWTDSPVYLRFNGTGDWHPWESPRKLVPADTNTIEIKADKAEIVVVVREPKPPV